jgi:hypothetical protein
MEKERTHLAVPPPPNAHACAPPPPPPPLSKDNMSVINCTTDHQEFFKKHKILKLNTHREPNTITGYMKVWHDKSDHLQRCSTMRCEVKYRTACHTVGMSPEYCKTLEAIPQIVQIGASHHVTNVHMLRMHAFLLSDRTVTLQNLQSMCSFAIVQ